MSAPSEKLEVTRWDVWNSDLRMTPHTGTRINRDDSYWTPVVLATDFDTLTRELQQTEAAAVEYHALLATAQSETADLRREVEGMRAALTSAQDVLTNPAAKFHEQITVALGIIGNALAATRNIPGGKP